MMRDWLRTKREERGLTMLELSAELGISESYYCQIEHGERQKRMDIALVGRLAQALQMPVCRIVLLENQPPVSTSIAGEIWFEKFYSQLLNHTFFFEIFARFVHSALEVCHRK